MAPPEDKMTEYERKRLENIRRNGEMMAALQVQSKASQLSQSAKRQRVQSNSYKQRAEKKSKRDSPVVIRRSLRGQGMPAENEKTPPSVLGPLSMTDAHDGAGSSGTLVATLLSINKKPQLLSPVKSRFAGRNVLKKGEIEPGVPLDAVRIETEGFEEEKELESLIDLGSMKLETGNIGRVVPGRVLNVKFMPCSHLRMVVAGSKLGNVGFWNMDAKGDDDHHNGIYSYRPHTGAITGILVQESCFSKIITSCSNGYIRMMDAKEEVFNLVHHSDEPVTCLSRPPNDGNSLFFGEAPGGLTVWDERKGKASSQWFPHEDSINSIHFNPRNPNIVATGSSDGTARLWDLRYVGSGRPKGSSFQTCLKMVSHNRVVQSAYFSPSGNSLATTSSDGYVGIQSVTDFEDSCMIPYDKLTITGPVPWFATFRGIWGWDDSYVFIGNVKGGVDVISPVGKRVITTLESSLMRAMPFRFDAHPYHVGMLGGGGSNGDVYVWTSS